MSKLYISLPIFLFSSINSLTFELMHLVWVKVNSHTQLYPVKLKLKRLKETVFETHYAFCKTLKEQSSLLLYIYLKVQIICMLKLKGVFCDNLPSEIDFDCLRI